LSLIAVTKSRVVFCPSGGGKTGKCVLSCDVKVWRLYISHFCT